MERNIDDFLKNPNQQSEMDSLTEDQLYEKFEKDLYEAMMQIMTPFQNQNTTQKATEYKPLQMNTATRDYAYKGKSTSVVKRSDKVALSKNKDLNVTKGTIQAAFRAIIAASSKTKLGSQITSILRTTEKRLFQKIDQKIAMEKKLNGSK